jgi:hypothetical protein
MVAQSAWRGPGSLSTTVTGGLRALLRFLFARGYTPLSPAAAAAVPAAAERRPEVTPTLSADEVGRTVEHRGRSEVDDPSPPAVLHQWQQRRGRQERAGEVDVDYVLPIQDGDVLEPEDWEEARAVDQHLDGPRVLAGDVCERLRVGLGRDVDRQREQTGLALGMERQLLQCVLARVRGDDLSPLRRKRSTSAAPMPPAAPVITTTRLVSMVSPVESVFSL